MMKQELILYYGTETPLLTVSHQLKNSFVVLQDYHPIVQHRVYADYFPLAERFLYFNCCKIPMEGNDLPASEIKFAQKDSLWNCLTLDLKRTNHRNYLLQKASKLLEYEGVNGFFIDDLDVWGNSPQDQKALLGFLTELESLLPEKFYFIFNRGFPFWASKSHKLKAVIVEDVGFQSCTKLNLQDQKWLSQILHLHVPLILHKSQSVSVFFLDYENKTKDLNKNAMYLHDLLKEFEEHPSIQFLRSESRNLNQWPLKLQNHFSNQR
jgi:hypothetical protein